MGCNLCPDRRISLFFAHPRGAFFRVKKISSGLLIVIFIFDISEFSRKNQGSHRFLKQPLAGFFEEKNLGLLVLKKLKIFKIGIILKIVF